MTAPTRFRPACAIPPSDLRDSPSTMSTANRLIPLRRFLGSCGGAITVEYVILAAGITFLGIFMLDGQRGAFRSLWDIVSGGDGSDDQVRSGEPVEWTHVQDFSAGPGDWVGASVTDIDGFGPMLGPLPTSGGRESVTRDYRPDVTDASEFVLNFDVMGMDTLDGEDCVFYIDGVAVGRVNVNYRGPTVIVASENVDGVAFEGTVVSQGSDIGGFRRGSYEGFRDAMINVTITVDGPGDNVSFGVGSAASQGYGDESYGIDNVVATSR